MGHMTATYCYLLIIIHSCLEGVSHFFWKFSYVLRTRAAKTFPFGVIHISKIVKCSCFSHLDEDISRIYIMKSEARYSNADHIFIYNILDGQEKEMFTLAIHKELNKWLLMKEECVIFFFSILNFLFFSFAFSRNIFGINF